MDKKKQTKKIPKILGFRLHQEDIDLYCKIKDIAKKQDRSLSYVMKEILRKEVLTTN